jgi:hypothetical protein
VTRAWSRLRGRGAAAIAAAFVLAAVAIGAAAQEQGPPIPDGLEEKPIRQTTCWTCHGDNKWVPPLRDPFIAIEPPATTGAPVGTEFNWTVAFRMTWNPKPSVPHLLFADPALDLTEAPSLRFGGGHPPVHEEMARSIAIDLQKPPNQRQENLTRLQVDPGVTELKWTVTPRDPRADIILLVRAPAGNQTEEVDASGPGGAETITYTGEALASRGSGNWTVGAGTFPIRAVAPNPSNITAPQLARTDFTLRHDALYDTASLKVLSNPHQVYTPGGGIVLQTWPVKCVAEPAPGERVKVTFGNVMWYQHQPPVSGGDFAKTSDGLGVNATMEGDRCVLVFEPQGVVVRPKPAEGVTVTRFSEVLGYASAFLLLSSIVSGGMLGQASRRGLNRIFDSAKRRVAYHNFLSYGLTAAALLHMVLFLVPLVPGNCAGPAGLCRPSEEFWWSTGLLWFGGPAILAMAGLGVTGFLQVPMIRRWSYPTWKWWHYGLTVATIVFTVMHMLIDGQNFGQNNVVPDAIYEALKDPLAPEHATP